MDGFTTFLSGKANQAYKMMGAHPLEKGFRFTVWAPSAAAVALVGDFNNWSFQQNPMREIAEGIFTVDVPEAESGQCYKFAIQSVSGEWVLKADPYAFQAELRPNTASVLSEQGDCDWSDADFLARRRPHDQFQPINIYEIHVGSWRRRVDGQFLTYDELGDELIPYLLDMHYTHVEFMPLMEHPLDASWGYQVTGYYAPSSRFGTGLQLKNLINRLHRAGIGVIFDWVPGHFPKDEQGLIRFSGQPCYENPDETLGERRTWGTLVFDYANPAVRSFLISNAFYWIDEFHVDGLRYDAVSSMIYRDYDQGTYISGDRGDVINHEAVAFLQELNQAIHDRQPSVLLFAEESSDFPKVTHPVCEGGLGFSYKWNLGWMHDSLDYFSSDYIHRPYQHNRLTFSMLYAFNERHLLAMSHDEVVHGKRALMEKMPGDYWRKFASCRSMLAYMMTHPGAKLLFMGGEFGQFMEWHYYEPLDWFILEYDMHRKLQEFVRRLNLLYRNDASLWSDEGSWHGFAWIEADDAERSVFSYIRRGQTRGELIVVLNMLPTPIDDFSLQLAEEADYEMILNSDAEVFGGSAYRAMELSGEQCLAVRLDTNGELRLRFPMPPLAAVILRRS